MPLTCGCDWDGDYAWYYETPDDYCQREDSRAKRCCSCGTLVKPGETCTVFPRFRFPRSDVEFKIYGEETHIYLASWVHCETCADLWFSLRELGYECVAPGEDVRELVKEYADLQRERRHSLKESSV